MTRVMPVELLNWEEVHQLGRVLAARVQDSGFRPQLLVAIGRGGYVPARILADYLDLMTLTAIRIEHYHGTQKQREARVQYPLGHAIAGQDILIIDDVSDSGDTYQVALDYLHTLNPGEVRTAALHHKQSSNYTPDYYAELVTTWRWLTYPWAEMEDLSGFIRQQGLSDAPIEDIQQALLLDYGIEVPAQTVADVLTFIF